MNHATNETACPSCNGMCFTSPERECDRCGGTGCADPETFFKTPRNDYATIAHKVDLSLAISSRPCVGTHCDEEVECIRHIRITDVVDRYDSLVKLWRTHLCPKCKSRHSPADFEALELVGSIKVEGTQLLMRRCSCGTTMSRRAS